MDDSVGGQLGGKKNSLIHYRQWAEHDPDELTDAGDLISGTGEPSLDCHLVGAR